MSRRRPLSYLAEVAVGAVCFERRAADPALVARLRADTVELSLAPPEGIVADPLWEAKRAALRHLLATGDPARFMRWPPVRTTMVKRGHRPVTIELRHLRRRADWAERWRPALREMTLGRPRPFPRLPTTSANTLHLAYHLCRFEEATGVRPETASFVLEFGGGYGGMCSLLHRLGFRGAYTIFDLPEVGALQRFYLRHARVPVVTISALDDLRRVVAARPRGPALFIATWSLGETPLALRAPLLAAVADFDAVLLGYTSRFADIDNRAAFARWRTELPSLAWQESPLPHLGKAEWYLFGARPGLARHP
ncbi:MAG TPA: hypothetical protein VFV05_02765 [Methylomirabilota bacterium]|nr:hypothetical protein [Methylomirabilota bacterium]